MKKSGKGRVLSGAGRAQTEALAGSNPAPDTILLVKFIKMRNDNPFEPWNGPLKDHPSAPWNGPDRDNPSACWNNPSGEGKYREEADKYKF